MPAVVAEGTCDAISKPKIKSRNITTLMSNINAAPLEKRTEVELLLAAKSVIWMWAQVNRFCDAKQKLENQSILTTTTTLDGLQKVLSEKQTKPFGFLQATQDNWKWEFFMSDFEWTASAESGSDCKVMLLDNVENL